MSIENSSGSFEKEPQQDPIVQEILGTLYKTEKILAQKVEQIGVGEIKVTFVFPPYERTIQPLDHVSMSQMHEAVLDGLYCSIGQAIKNRVIDTPIDFQMFQAKKLDSIYFRENFSFRRMLKSNEPAELIFKVVSVEEKKIRKTFYSVTVEVDGFMRGEVECLL
ncbi:MAG: hypothetical protein CO029_01245, partial [Candidatus Magasanikbacteria bacterium CG_4_9_14_0_2_um_filter_41_10]